MIQGRITAETTGFEVIDHLLVRVKRLSRQDYATMLLLMGGDLDPVVSAMIARETNDRGETLKQVHDRIYS